MKHKPTCNCATLYWTAPDDNGVQTLWRQVPGEEPFALADEETSPPDVWRLLTESGDVRSGNMRWSAARMDRALSAMRAEQ